MWGDVAIAFILAFIVAFMATPYTIKLAKKIGAVDVPKDERRMHKRAMPKFGGPAVILGFLVSVIYLLIVMRLEDTIILNGPENYGMKLIGLFLGIVIISITCIIDDIKTIKPIVKLSGQLLAAIVAGALVGFLPFNFAPAKTFIGDTGSNFLGYTISIIAILGMAKTYTLAVIILPLIVLGLPIFDTLWAIIRRLIKGKSIKAIFKADKGHLHHRIVARGFSQKQAVLVLYGISATFGIFAIIFFDSGIWKALSFLIR